MDGRAVHPRWRKKHQQPRHSRSMKICHNSSKAPKVACYDATNFTIIIYCNGLKAVPSYQSTRPWMRQTNPANRPSLAAFVSAITRYQEFLARHIEHFSEISVSMCVWMLFMKLNIARGQCLASVLREWILEVREVKNEMKIWFTHFEKWKVKWKSVSLISRMKSEM